MSVPVDVRASRRITGETEAGLRRLDMSEQLGMAAGQKLVFRVVHCGDWYRDGFHPVGWLVEVQSPEALIERDPSRRANGGLVSLTDAFDYMKKKHKEYARRNEAD